MIKIYMLMLTSIFLFALTPEEEAQKTKRNDRPMESRTLTTKTYSEATNSENSRNWNNQDWKNHIGKNGNLDTGLIGSSQSSLKNIKGNDIALDGNPNNLNSATLRQNSALSDVKSIHSYSDELQNSVLQTNISRTNSNINLEQTTKCYITREMPTRYKCDKTGLVYGGGINTSGSEAKKICETECYEQFTCVNVNPTAQAQSAVLGNLNISGKQEQIIESSVVTKIENIEFDAKITSGKLFLDIIFVTLDGKEKAFAKKNPITKNEKYTIRVGQDSQSIKIIAYGNEDSSSGALNSVTINYKKEDKFICPSSQDISDKNPGDFAYLCPSGKIKTFNVNNMSYKICEDYGVVGNNKDGTFSNAESCSNICKNTFDCKLDTISVATNSLQNFREGCIEGQPNCSIDTCRQMRLNQNQIINENVFYADFQAHPTIVSGTPIQGIERPKILLSEDIDFQTRSREEWKDGAYGDMIKRGTYRFSAVTLNQDTQSSDAFNMGMESNSTDTTLRGSAIRSLYWVNKPKAFDVGNNVEYKYYAVLEATIDSLKYDLNGNRIRVKDKVLYVKINEEDNFKAFAIKRNFAKKDLNGLDDSALITAVWSYEYFNTSLNRWFSHSANTQLEHFKKSAIVMNEPYVRIPIVTNNNNLSYKLPGVIRSIIRNGPNETLIYNGDFLGSGQAITQLKLYVEYSKDSMTYEQIVQKIDMAELEPIYNNSSISSSPQNVISDTLNKSDSLTIKNARMQKSNEDIEIFMYGTANNKTAYTRIKPKEEDVGKKVFVYIFAQ